MELEKGPRWIAKLGRGDHISDRLLLFSFLLAYKQTGKSGDMEAFCVVQYNGCSRCLAPTTSWWFLGLLHSWAQLSITAWTCESKAHLQFCRSDTQTLLNASRNCRDCRHHELMQVLNAGPIPLLDTIPATLHSLRGSSRLALDLWPRRHERR